MEGIDEQTAWIRRSAASRAEAEAALAAPDPERGRRTFVLVLGLALVAAFVALVWTPTLILFEPTRAGGGYETGWSTVGISPGGGFGHRVLLDLVVLVPFVLFSIVDLWLLRTGGRVRWETARMLLALGLLIWSASLAVLVDGLGKQAVVTTAAMAQVLLSTALAVLLVVEHEASARRLAGLGVMILFAANALSAFADLDDPDRAERCDAYVRGFSEERCVDVVHAGLMWGLAMASVLWCSGAVVLLVAARRRLAASSKPTTFERRLPAVAMAFVVTTGLIGVTCEVAVARDWCTEAPMVKAFTRHEDCSNPRTS